MVLESAYPDIVPWEVVFGRRIEGNLFLTGRPPTIDRTSPAE